MLRVITSWTLYWIGDLWSKLTYWTWLQEWFEWPYRSYSWIMCLADDVQGDDPRGPWSPAVDDTLDKTN